MGLFEGLKQFDLYRQIPKDLSKSTTTGGTVSVVCMLMMFILFVGEFSAFWAVEHESHIVVEAPMDTGNQHAMIQINMNITLPRLPCALMSVDAQDVMGSHVLDVGGQLHKSRVDGKGRVKVDDEGKPLEVDLKNPQEEKGEGCNVHGTMIVKKVPGNFHISVHAHAELISVFFPTGMVNVSHVIHDLSFGDKDNADQLSVVDTSVTNPLKGAYKWAVFADAQHAQSYEYYIKIVPTNYIDLAKRVFESYQFSANSNEIVGRYRIPAIYFRYDMSAVTVNFKEKKVPFTHFMVQVCAIIGGVFTVLGLVNSLVITTTKHFKKTINKLG